MRDRAGNDRVHKCAEGAPACGVAKIAEPGILGRIDAQLLIGIWSGCGEVGWTLRVGCQIYASARRAKVQPLRSITSSKAALGK